MKISSQTTRLTVNRFKMVPMQLGWLNSFCGVTHMRRSSLIYQYGEEHPLYYMREQHLKLPTFRIILLPLWTIVNSWDRAFSQSSAKCLFILRESTVSIRHWHWHVIRSRRLYLHLMLWGYWQFEVRSRQKGSNTRWDIYCFFKQVCK